VWPRNGMKISGCFDERCGCPSSGWMHQEVSWRSLMWIWRQVACGRMTSNLVTLLHNASCQIYTSANIRIHSPWKWKLQRLPKLQEISILLCSLSLSKKEQKCTCEQRLEETGGNKWVSRPSILQCSDGGVWHLHLLASWLLSIRSQSVSVKMWTV
jgi:hypothetical protein